MACIVQNQRYQAIFDLAVSLAYNPNDSGVKGYNDFVKYVQNKASSFGLGTISEVEISKALFPLEKGNIDQLVEQLQQKKVRMSRLRSAVDKLNKVLQARTEVKGKSAPTDEAVAEINNLIKDIYYLANTDVPIPPEAYNKIISNLHNLAVLQDAHFDLEPGEVQESHIRRAIEHAATLKKLAKIDNLESRLEDLDNKIKRLNTGDFTFQDIEEIDGFKSTKAFNAEIAELEIQLEEKKTDVDVLVRDLRIKRQSGNGILGIKNGTTQKIRSVWGSVVNNIYEPGRAIKFMADASGIFQQLAWASYSMMAGVNLKDLASGNFAEAFAEPKELGKMIWQTTFRVAHDAVKNKKNMARVARSTYARELFNNMKSESPDRWAFAKKMGIHFSEIGSLTRSEEMFTSDVLNKVPGLGGMKDISEAIMSSQLNAMRWHMWKKYMDMYGGTFPPEAEAREAAEFINNMTGTINKWEGFQKSKPFLGKLMSAPGLAASRVALLIRPFQVLASIDVTRKSGSIWKNSADRFIALQVGKAMAGFAAFSLFMAMALDWDLEEDPLELDFLRYRAGDTAIDMTGGIGSMLRGIQKMLYLGVGVPDAASYTTHDKINYMRDVQKQGALRPLVQVMIENKLHPTISGMESILTGVDFFGERYNLISDDAFGSRIEAVLRAGMPISFEQLLDDYVKAQEEGVTLEGLAEFNPQDWAEITASMGSTTLQAFGANTFRYDNNMSDMGIQEMQNRLESRLNPKYPEELSKPIGNHTKRYYRSKYRKMWGDILGDLIMEVGPENVNNRMYKALNKRANIMALRAFREKYKEVLDEKGLTIRAARIAEREAKRRKARL